MFDNRIYATIFVLLFTCKYKCRKNCEVIKKFFDVLINAGIKILRGWSTMGLTIRGSSPLPRSNNY